eukprot:SAG31_NODE_4168_length_3512_cov_1.611192_3_plen_107_part_01
MARFTYLSRLRSSNLIGRGSHRRFNRRISTTVRHLLFPFFVTKNAGDIMCPLRINSSGSWLLHATNAPISSNRSLSTFLVCCFPAAPLLHCVARSAQILYFLSLAFL